MKINAGRVTYSPSDLVRYLESPFASWMDRFHLETPGKLYPAELSEDARLVIDAGIEHEKLSSSSFARALTASWK